MISSRSRIKRVHESERQASWALLVGQLPAPHSTVRRVVASNPLMLTRLGHRHVDGHYDVE